MALLVEKPETEGGGGGLGGARPMPGGGGGPSAVLAGLGRCRGGAGAL